jgi:hypothetical protein
MNPGLSVREGQLKTPEQRDRPATRWFAIASWSIVAVLSSVRFSYLTADFPNGTPWMTDQAKFTDEGWWANGAVMHHLLGHWNVPGDYNPAVGVPVWPGLLGVLFHFTGVSVEAARALNVIISIATVGVIYALVRRYTNAEDGAPALLAALLLSASPFAFVFSRLAILDTLVIFEFCLLMLIASFASTERIWPLLALTILTIVMILTKTTAVLLIPPIFWLTWQAMGQRPANLVRAVLALVVASAAMFKGYAMLVSALGYGADYRYFFVVNEISQMAWDHAFWTLRELLRNGFWIDRILYPLGLVILLLSVVWKRGLWRNPLFTASWIAFVIQAAFIFRRQDDYAPRYFLMMLPPLVWIVVLMFSELKVGAKLATALLLFAIAVSAGMNVSTIAGYVFNRGYQFETAALSIKDIIKRDTKQNPLMFGVSASELSLMTGIPSINDAYGTEDMAEKALRYQPGWYVAWNGVGDEERKTFLAPFRLEEVARYPAFDDDERNELILYKMVPR